MADSALAPSSLVGTDSLISGRRCSSHCPPGANSSWNRDKIPVSLVPGALLLDFELPSDQVHIAGDLALLY